MTLTNPSLDSTEWDAHDSAARRTLLAAVHAVSDHLIELRIQGSTIGFIETVGPVFVALAGSRYDRAEEVGQSLTMDGAAIAIMGAHSSAAALAAR